MGQQDIYDFLYKNRGRYFSVVEISALTGLSDSSIQVSLRKLRHRGEIVLHKQVDHQFYYGVDPE